ncbi:AraC family transcriptional regulator [Dyadobacter sp. CY356]|uniref:AraC family transcriptional regulator n=1 Tax=Dyadobacter sp. CY356 TaxID=2906442 RepID=UPI001F425065|nr:AraC family transcriptional regulator [Dyadobacter sp. CY356]MCF0056318.1 AraC family transcriptional regulator [Dyadobacter sp. CY356]
MQKEILHAPYVIKYETLDVCPKPEHAHSFFELVYVRSGTGLQCINKSSFAYRAGHLFLLTPDDCHSFDIQTTSQLFFLQFNDIYIKNNGIVAENVKRLEFILQNANHQPGCIFRNKDDKMLVGPIIEAIIREHETRDIYNQELIHQLVNTLIIIIARNIAKFLPEKVNMATEEKAIDVLQYIQNNIYYPEKLKAENVSGHFGISNSYLGRYFKKHTGETMQEYISSYKTKLIQHRLKFSDKRLNEISDEFGFTDISHLNKYFINQTGSSPAAYRISVRNESVLIQ